jgi:hypothetical protein
VVQKPEPNQAPTPTGFAGPGTTSSDTRSALRRFEEAIARYQDAAAIFRETGDGHSEDIAIKNLERVQAAATADRQLDAR